MLRRILLLPVALVVLATAAGARVVADPGAPAAPTFSFTGRGWGHGVGLAQYGALGYARSGRRHVWILAHYYPGTRLGQAPVRRVRVLLAEGKARARVSSLSDFVVEDGAGARRRLVAGPYAVVPGPALVGVDGIPVRMTGPLLFRPGAARLEFDGRAYRGALEVAQQGKRLRVVNGVGLDAYLYGVITSEMPSHWPAEALKAQAVAARSYALVSRRGGDFDLYSDVRSQVYGGAAAETASARAAVDATAGEVLFHGRNVASTFFFASSGGRTADVTEIWPTSQPVPYLVPVDDPHDTLSPYHRWGPVEVDGAAIGKALKLGASVERLSVSRGPSGRVREVVLETATTVHAVPGNVFRRALDLRSTWFRVARR